MLVDGFLHVCVGAPDINQLPKPGEGLSSGRGAGKAVTTPAVLMCAP